MGLLTNLPLIGIALSAALVLLMRDWRVSFFGSAGELYVFNYVPGTAAVAGHASYRRNAGYRYYRGGQVDYWPGSDSDFDADGG